MEQIMQEIKRVMAERSVTGYAIAKATGMSFAQVYRIISGKHTSVANLQQVCRALGLELTVKKRSV